MSWARRSGSTPSAPGLVKTEFARALWEPGEEAIARRLPTAPAGRGRRTSPTPPCSCARTPRRGSPGTRWSSTVGPCASPAAGSDLTERRSGRARGPDRVSRRSVRRTLPFGSGAASRPPPAPGGRPRGRAWTATSSRRSSSRGVPPGRSGTTQATTRSPHSGSGRFHTATWSTPGWPASTVLDRRRPDLLAAGDDHLGHASEHGQGAVGVRAGLRRRWAAIRRRVGDPTRPGRRGAASGPGPAPRPPAPNTPSPMRTSTPSRGVPS